jgi:hypothetical protein
MKPSRFAALSVPCLAVLGSAACTPETSSPTAPPREIVSGSSQGCAIYGDETVACWTLSPTPAQPRRARPVPKLRHVEKVVLTGILGCALDRDGTVHCWSYVDRDISVPCEAEALTQLPPMRSIAAARWGSYMRGIAKNGEPYYWSVSPSRNWFGDPALSVSPATTTAPSWTQDDFTALNDQSPACTLEGKVAQCRTWDGASFVVEL